MFTIFALDELALGILMPIPTPVLVPVLMLPLRSCLVLSPPGKTFVLLMLLKPEVDEMELFVE